MLSNVLTCEILVLFGCDAASWWSRNAGVHLEVLVLLFVVQSAVPCRAPPPPLMNLMPVYSERAESRTELKCGAQRTNPNLAAVILRIFSSSSPFGHVQTLAGSFWGLSPLQLKVLNRLI